MISRTELVGWIAIAILAGSATAQTPLSLVTTYVGGNGQNGAMFDLAATGSTPLRIQSFSINTSGVGTTVEVYAVTAGTTFVGNETNAAAWTLIGTAIGVNGAGLGNPTPLNLSLNHALAAGQRTGFYVTQTVGSLQYTNGTAVGNVFAFDPLLTFYEGIGKSYPFATNFTPRVFNGTIHYNVDRNFLQLSQSGPGVGDLTVSLTLLSPTGFEGWTLLSGNTALPLGTGPILGMWPDALTFSILGFPYFPGNPFHFRLGDAGLFPNTPFVAGPGTVTSLTGLTVDAGVLILSPFGAFDSVSNTVRHTFQ